MRRTKVLSDGKQNLKRGLGFPCAPEPDGIAYFDSDGPKVEIVLRVPRGTRDLIDQRSEAAGYSSRTRFMVDSAVRSPLPAYEELATCIGRIGYLADQLLLRPHEAPVPPRTATKLAKALMEATRALMLHLQRPR